MPNFLNTNSVLQHLNKNFQNLIMPSKDTAVDSLHVSSNQTKQSIGILHVNRKNVPSSVQAKILEKGEHYIKVSGTQEFSYGTVRRQWPCLYTGHRYDTRVSKKPRAASLHFISSVS